MISQKEYKNVLLEIARDVHILVFVDNRDETLLRRFRNALRDFAAQEKKHRDYMKGQSVVSSDMQIPDECKTLVTKYFRPDRKVTPPVPPLRKIQVKDKDGNVKVIESRSLDGHHRIVLSPSELNKEEAEQRDLIGLACIYDNCRVRIGKQDKINDSIVPEDTYDGVWRYISGDAYFYEGKAEFWKTALTSIHPERKSAEMGQGNKKTKGEREGEIEPKPPEIFQKILWILKYGRKHWKLVSLAILIVLFIWILSKINLFS